MASRIKHIALSSEDPAKTAAFYKEVFGMTELHRKPGDTGDDGVWLTDGYIYFAILKFKSHEAPDMGVGPSTVSGVHHIGFYVDDLEEACQTIESASATVCPESSQANRKYRGPEGLMIDLRARGWDEQIQAKTQLFALAPVESEE
jgi:catechol 2,3-dioxygenase-like lactoylglutathione lyase family enzyme